MPRQSRPKTNAKFLAPRASQRLTQWHSLTTKNKMGRKRDDTHAGEKAERPYDAACETFRFSQLLSAGAVVISDHCTPADERECVQRS